MTKIELIIVIVAAHAVLQSAINCFTKDKDIERTSGIKVHIWCAALFVLLAIREVAK